MTDVQKVTDWKGREIKVGMTVIYGCPPPGQESDFRVEVMEITDFDADYNDELGRPEMYPPRVRVHFNDGTEDTVSTYNNTPYGWNDYPDGPSQLIFAADDLEVIR